MSMKKLALVTALALGAVAPAFAGQLHTPHGVDVVIGAAAPRPEQAPSAEQPRPQDPQPSSGCDCGGKR
jgi:hypothetical protein